MPGLRVAVDVTPLLGVRTGIFQCVDQLLAALPDAAPDIEVVPYVLSRSARARAGDLPAGTRFLPVPAGIAVTAWGWVDLPRVDKVLADVDVGFTEDLRRELGIIDDAEDQPLLLRIEMP